MYLENLFRHITAKIQFHLQYQPLAQKSKCILILNNLKSKDMISHLGNICNKLYNNACCCCCANTSKRQTMTHKINDSATWTRFSVNDYCYEERDKRFYNVKISYFEPNLIKKECSITSHYKTSNMY